MTNLGALYLNGQGVVGLGVVQDFSKARELYEKAAEKGDATAQCST